MKDIYLKLCSYAKQDTRMDLDNQNELKKFKEEYRIFLNTLWDNIKNNKREYKKYPDRGPYSDPDSFFKNNVRNNSLFYEDLCKFLNCQTDSKKYAFEDSYIKYKGRGKCYGEKFYPDQFGFSAPCTNLNHIYDKYLQLSQKNGKNKEETIENVINWIIEARTIGGAFIWPKTKGRRKSYNVWRGGSSNIKGGCYIEDRVDLTLLEIKHYLENTINKKEKLPKCREEDRWLDSFKKLDPCNPFKKYVDTFHFNSFVNENYVPYDIVNSDFAKGKIKIINENEVNYSKENSIYKIEDLEMIERILNNVNILIKERTKKILQKINKK